MLGLFQSNPLTTISHFPVSCLNSSLSLSFDSRMWNTPVWNLRSWVIICIERRRPRYIRNSAWAKRTVYNTYICWYEYEYYRREFINRTWQTLMAVECFKIELFHFFRCYSLECRVGNTNHAKPSSCIQRLLAFLHSPFPSTYLTNKRKAKKTIIKILMFE